MRRLSWWGLPACAAFVALAPRPAALVERVYARQLYPWLQAVVTTASNAVPFALFDLALAVAVVFCLWCWARAVSRARHSRSWLPLQGVASHTLGVAAAAYLWFVAVWGLNYARPPIEARLHLSEVPPTEAEVETLLTQAVSGANAWYQPAHAADTSPYNAEHDIAAALHEVEASHGRPRRTVAGRPKPSLLAPYFRMAGVDGLTAPVALETLLNPDLTDAEHPFVLAHEWAHLSGYAHEADANFVAWLATMQPRAAPMSRYSGSLFLVMETAAQVAPGARRRELEGLEAGPRRDLDAIAARARQRVEFVQRAGWRIYDSYLKAQGVTEGVASYSRVVALVVQARRGSEGPGTTSLVPQ